SAVRFRVVVLHCGRHTRRADRRCCRALRDDAWRNPMSSAPSNSASVFAAALEAASTVLAGLAPMESKVALAAQWCVDAFAQGNKILVCGNGGSAAEAQHLVGELMGRYKRSRRALAAVALNADSTLLTCIGNDFAFEDAYARQVEGLGKPSDLLIV